MSAPAPELLEKTEMTLLHLYRDDMGGFARQDASWIEKVSRRLGAALRTFHRGIIRARLRRIRREMLFRPDYDEMFPPEQDASRFPQRPMILGDKWDF